MNDAVKAILERSRELAILKNNDSEALVRNQGVLFGKYIDDSGSVKYEAWIVTLPSIVRWSNLPNLDFPEDRPWFDYAKGEFTEIIETYSLDDVRRQYSLTLNEFSERDIQSGRSNVFPVPIVNVLDRIGTIYGGDNIRMIERSRTIIKNNNGFVFDNELILTYDKARDMFFHPSMDGVEFYVHKNSNITEGFTDNMKYRAVLIEEPEENRVVLVDIRDVYFKGIEIGIHEVEAGTYFPDSERDVIDFSRYPDNRIVRYPYLETPPDNGFSFQPIHVETPALFYALRLMEGYTYAYLAVSAESRELPFVISGVKDDSCSDMPDIEVLLGPLKPEIRGYHL